MVKTLQDIIAQGVKPTNISLILSPKQAKYMTKEAQRKIEACAYTIANIDKQPEDKREKIKYAAEQSAKFWEDIAKTLESQL